MTQLRHYSGKRYAPKRLSTRREVLLAVASRGWRGTTFCKIALELHLRKIDHSAEELLGGSTCMHEVTAE